MNGLSPYRDSVMTSVALIRLDGLLAVCGSSGPWPIGSIQALASGL